jgi:uncharacterized protein (DUF924 family)/alkylated DNA repair dioxygenase AlkB/Ran GTPase-activating protein (RanGAP) involved in mRNA processing and transport
MQHFGDSTALRQENELVSKHDTYTMDLFGSGDTQCDNNLLTKDEADDAFKQLFGGEIKYQQWHHMPDKKKGLLPLSRLKIAMADCDKDGWTPHYRFPVNNQDHHGVVAFTPTVRKIMDMIVKRTGIPYNHAVVLLYRDGKDCIGFHKDKTLDLSKVHPIASVSLGQPRTYMLRDNIHNPTKSQELTLGHGTLLLLGMKTNEEWYHSIPMTAEPLGARISLTFRVVTTFKNIHTGEIKGEGDKYTGVNWPKELGGSHIIYPDEILSFWFGADRALYNSKLWWGRFYRVDYDADSYIKDTWGYLLDHYEKELDLFKDNHYLKSWMGDVDGLMALVLLFDQFPRHIYRGTAKSFYFDSYATVLVKHLLGHEISNAYRMFAYVALMHCEDPAMVSEAVLGLLKLANQDGLPEWKRGFAKTARVAQEHYDILKKYGRYPHRNAILGRESTEQEMELLSSKKLFQWMRSVETRDPKEHKAPKTEDVVSDVKTKLKILVLHSNRQTAESFKNKTEKYFKKLKGIADLTYCNAPKPYEPAGEAKKVIQKYTGVNNNGRVWWNASDDPKTMVYNGLEDSLRYVDSFFKNDHYDGIIGFSQGGALVGIIAALVNDSRKGLAMSVPLDNISRSLKFVVVISGFYCRDTRPEFKNCLLEELPMAHLPELVKMRKDLITIPSFHVWGTDDTLVNPWRSAKLSEAFSDAKIHTHGSGHFAKAIKYWPVDQMAKWLEGFVEKGTTDKALCLEVYDDAVQLYDALTKSHSNDAIYELLLRTCREDTLMWKQLIRLDTRGTNETFRKILTMMIGDELCGEYKKYYIEKSPGVPSKLVMYAPKYNNIYRASRLFHDVAVYLAAVLNVFDEKSNCILEDHEKRQLMLSYNQYRKVISRLSTLLHAPADKPNKKKHIPRTSLEELMKMPLDESIVHPRAEPVDVSPPELLEPLYNFLRSDLDSKIQQVFEKGTVCVDKRLDLCKQVIGPGGVNSLIDSLRVDSLSKCPKVHHLLLGNNICGDALGFAVGEFIKSGKSALTTWYIAGNNLTEKGIAPVCEALWTDKQVRQLWLKRNPLYTGGVSHIVKMLSYNTCLKVLDMTNTGLMDEGAIMLLGGINEVLEYLYLGANGLTERTCEVASKVLNKTKLKQLALGCNRLGDTGAKYLADALRRDCVLESLEIASCGVGVEGARYVADALKENKSLVSLNFGFLKSTNDLSEVPNMIGSDGGIAFADMLAVNKTLRSLDIVYTGIQQAGINALAEVLSSKNGTLIHINLEQFGIPHNELSREIIRKSIQKNKESLSEEELKGILDRVDPPHLEEIKSVYRIASSA